VASTAHRQRVGAELRRLRESLGLSGTQVAEALGWSQSKISRIETGRFGVTVWELAALLDYYGVPEEVRAELLAVTAEGTGVEGAWIVRAGGTHRRQGEVAAVESRVTRIRQYQAMAVPGQLQSPDYTRALACAGGYPDPDSIALQRRRRQELLEGTDAPEYLVIVDARALTRWPGPSEVMLRQIDYMVERANLSSVTLHVLPPGGQASAVAFTSFVLYDFRERTSPTVVMVESQTADLYLSADRDVEAYAALFDRLRNEALDPVESLKYLKTWARTIRRGLTTKKER